MTNEEFVANLRLLADYYEANPELPLPDFGCSGVVYIYDVNGREEMSKVAQIFGACEKTVTEEMFKLNKKVGGFTLEAMDYRERVCTKRVLGTREVEKKRAIQYESYTETEEIVEWDCPPLLKQQEVSV